MAVNKRKILEAARKNAQKGAKQKALKDYGTLLQLDPKDAKLRLEIGDAHRRWGENEEAIGHYSKVAEQYRKDGFDARAVAVFKQILNLDPKRYTAYVSLAELYQRMGLDSEAVAALQTAADGYHKEGQRREALELLRRMAALDPSNTASRIKVGELLQQEGLTEEAVQEFEAVARELERQESRDNLTRVFERLLELEPGRADILVRMARNCVVLRQPERAAPLARQAAEIEPDSAEHWELLCDIYKTLEDAQALGEATRELARIHRDRGDEAAARQIMQRVPEGASSDFGAGDDTTEAEPLEDDDLLNDDFLETDAASQGVEPVEAPGPADSLDYSLDSDAADFAVGGDDEEDIFATPPVQEALDPNSITQGELPMGEPDQLFAEASVYLRYGKTDQAILSLKAVISQRPNDRAAIEKLGDAYAEKGKGAAAVGYWGQAAELARGDGDAPAVAILRDRIAALDADAANRIELLGPEPDVEPDLGVDDLDASSIGGDALGESDLDFEVEIDDSGVDAEADPVAAASAHDLEESFEDDLDVEILADDTTSDTSTLDPDIDDGAEVEIDDGFEVEVDGAEAESDEDSATATLATPADPSVSMTDGLDLSAASTAEVSDWLEEAEFYFEQGLLDEAESVYARILERAPNHPTALVRTGELADVREDREASAALSGSETVEHVDAAAVVDAGEAFAVAEETEEAGETAGIAEAEETAPIEAAEVAAEAAEAPAFDPREAETPAIVVSEPDVEVAADQVEAQELAEDVEVDEDDTDEIAAEAVPAPEPSSDTETAPLAAAPVDAAEGEDDSELFDLAAELRESLGDDEPGVDDPGTPAAGVGTEGEAFASLFAEFKKGVSATLESGDYETRFDLGIAYREMGLYEDALTEFGACVASPEKGVESLQMMGICALELGRVSDAIAHLQQALSVPEVSDRQRAGLLMGLAEAYRAGGDVDQARDALARLADIDAAWPGAAELLASLEPGSSAPTETAQPGGDEAYESFDDLIAEAEAEESVSTAATAAASSEATTEAPPESGTDTPDAESEAPRPRRKKRISFV